MEALPRSRSERRKRRARRRLWALLVVVTWPVVVLVADALLRGSTLRAAGWRYAAAYLASAVVSVVFWAALLGAASRRRRVSALVFGAVFVLLATLSLGGQIQFFSRFHGLLNPDLCRFPVQSAASQLAQLGIHGAAFAASHLPVLLLAVALVYFARRVVRPTRREAYVSTLVFGGALGVATLIPFSHAGIQPTTPDVLYLRALGTTVFTRLALTEESKRVRPELRRPLEVPTLTRRATPRRNVILIVGESLRQDVQCLDQDPECRTTEATRAALPRRVTFPRMRALSSTTGISMAVLFTGLGPHESRETLHGFPLLFEYARAAGFDAAYFTSHSMMFGNLHLWLGDLPVSRFVSASDVEPGADVDIGASEELLVPRVLADVALLKEPFFAVIQLANTHFPYRVDPHRAPFQPAERTASPAKREHFMNYYRNAVWLQDQALARLVRELRATPSGGRTVILFTPDHGEAFREHHQLGHSLSVYDEELLVGGWLDAPRGTLEPHEQHALEAASSSHTYHVDVTPTVLDLFGVWQAPELARFRDWMLGTSLLGEERTTRPLPITNCSALWSCSFENWGMLQTSRKLEARPWDSAWHCFDLEQDPGEKKSLGRAACADLASHAGGLFGRLPGRKR